MSAVHLITEHKGVPCAIADLSLAAWGRKELKIAESEMPALMAIRDQPLQGSALAAIAHDDELRLGQLRLRECLENNWYMKTKEQPC